MAEKYTPRSVQQGFRRGPGMMGAPIEKAENSKQTLLRLLAYFKPERKTVLLMSAAVLVSVLASVFAPSFQS